MDAALERAGFTKADLARRVNARGNTITDLFKGRTIPNEETLKNICRALNVSTGHILYDRPLKEYDENESARAPRRAVNTGVRLWLTSTLNGKSTTLEEREWLYSIPWPAEPVRAPDLAYEHARQAFRELHSRKRQ